MIVLINIIYFLTHNNCIIRLLLFILISYNYFFCLLNIQIINLNINIFYIQFLFIKYYFVIYSIIKN